MSVILTSYGPSGQSAARELPEKTVNNKIPVNKMKADLIEGLQVFKSNLSGDSIYINPCKLLFDEPADCGIDFVFSGFRN
jgi:hypothetical protein